MIEAKPPHQIFFIIKTKSRRKQKKEGNQRKKKKEKRKRPGRNEQGRVAKGNEEDKKVEIARE